MAIILSDKQKEAMTNADQRWNLFIGATRSGKSYVQQMLIPRRVKENIPGLYILMAKTQSNVESNILSPMRDILGPEFISRIRNINGVTVAKIFGKSFSILGGDNIRAVDKIRGKTIGYAAVDEGPTLPHPLIQLLKTRFTDPRAKADITGNPEGPRHTFKLDLIDRGTLPPGHKDYLRGVYHLSFGLLDNPSLTDDIREQLCSELRGVWYKRLILGLWAAAEDAIYDMFDPDKHITEIDPQENQVYRRYVGLDYGTGAPSAFIKLALLHTGQWIVTHEYYWDSQKEMAEKTDAQYVADLHRFVANPLSPSVIDPTIASIYADPSAKSFILAAKRERLPITLANNSVVDGIRHVASLFGADKLLIHKRCEQLLNELPGYTWDAKVAERGEDAPVKKDDHACDAMRYGIWSTIAISKSSSRGVIPQTAQSQFARLRGM